MKQSLYWRCLIAFFIFLWVVYVPKNGISSDIPDEIHRGKSQEKRGSITFIMGEDKTPVNRFYTKAAYYYRHDETDQTEFVETSLRSLTGVRDYLEENPPANGSPWGVINIVAHGNEWSGLGIPIFPGGERTTKDSLTAAIESGNFPPLNNDVIDAESEIRIQGCALGLNRAFLALIGKVFGGEDLQRPIVRSCRYFISYQTTESNGQISYCAQYLTDFWYAFYRSGYRPCDICLARRLRQRYPDADMNWREALKRTQPRYAGDIFHYTFDLPVKWIAIYPDKESCPDIRKKKDQQNWLNTQAELQLYINDVGIPIDYFEWRIRNIKYKCDDGTLKPAIKATGKCTILCVLKALTESDSTNSAHRRPLRPSITDTMYYTSVIPTEATELPFAENLECPTKP